MLMDRGGVTSHPAIIAREFHIPCIVGTNNATQCLASGDQITINFEHGEIFCDKTQKGTLKIPVQKQRALFSKKL
ncbi:MAG: hypothetical protein A3B74_00705 [Candidatus Kerfeldbacteria bacterium RIFCSPHIGHO2_02_FULL_42_14]|uniref:PEP-utilising enzyme mobile domain-containing protein n=1 Tax=Candidatus Kerfeldbacteria bacterium RIFCSPHIGHO2_02_FULL_42_14 TaxID=1798540 RepID=A0A1G2ATK1_9BACT|nr:MAG: hypothetical protein A3B74_00705 [Candidatus Kerfeldbacteria bacterium RIFCSPHIGHO2_02_FULL_42_14]OGY81877.1 MAG: hypothetical protein A3E60_00785 [Candidatus Kerfeldbacteria bacterium RIFCSPHIGHO2_12_FULL_42_13]OGY86986.1 MAG: hypothetical protein A3G01_01740 [Candidatus Kerfeldbacteria bacterium RIFCSPLOWO2_12_FULL_43_9]